MRAIVVALFWLIVTPAAGASVADDAPAGPGVDVVSKFEQPTSFLFLRPEGAWVKAGETVCELDLGPPGQRLERLRIEAKSAEADYQNSRLKREVAEIAVIAYVEATFKPEQETLKGEIALAEADLKRAEDRLDWSRKMKDKGYVSVAQYTSDQLTLQQALFQVEQARTKRNLLEKHTTGKTIKELKSEVEKARAEEQAKKLAWDEAKSAAAKLAGEARPFTVAAPVAGRITYTRPIDASTRVNRGDLLFRVVPEENR
jgi:multidrug resistance efflux pump